MMTTTGRRFWPSCRHGKIMCLCRTSTVERSDAAVIVLAWDVIWWLWSWLLAPSDVATPLRLPPTSPLPLLSLLHLLLHHCECFLERVTGGELVNLKIEAVVTESELS